MRCFAKSLALVAAAWCVSPQTAQAESVIRSAPKLTYLAPTPLSDETGAPLSLCYLGTARSAFGVEITYSADAYALATNECAATDYTIPTAEQFALFQQTGDFPAALPAEPQTPFAYRLRNYSVFGAIGIVALMVLAMIMRASMRRSLKSTDSNSDNTAVQVLAAMCFVTTADGQDHSNDISKISQTLAKLTGKKYSAQQIQDILDYTRDDPTAIDAIGADLNQNGRELVLEGALSVATLNGEIKAAEYNAVTQIAKMLQLPAQDFRAILSKIAQTRATA
ncbi:hypothetical protein BVC71_09550 [Marivivens niveibacter]|uniref:Co-chaperone DjlA N-terminal domain-containing protein n=1 Tax=Marivivens niveibacter TaxID=1930667 RepID=A0A251WWU8_9RHOB|nr:TerB family tellurite resistance protein [Marivivens niveibacter]OUD08949.1 hypothetical protein BVC71_09550 [Marivivens niveibacter]